MEYASKGVAGAGRGTGIAGLSLGVRNALGGAGGRLNVLGGGNAVCSENMPVSRYDSQKDAKIAQLETEVKLRDANTFTMGELGKLRDYVDGKFAVVNDKLCAQAVHNATNDAVLGCMQGQIAQLMGLTKLIVPSTSICPAPMPQYNSWTAPTASATGA